MNAIKFNGITLLVLLVLGSNLCLIAECLLVAIPIANFQFLGLNNVEKLNDMEPGTVAISADKMNVFYIGVDNPITVALSGVAAENLAISGEGVSVNRGDNGQYIVRCTKPGKATIAVSNKLTGKSRSMGFRVKRIPDPIVKINGKSEGFMEAGTFSVQTRLDPELTNFDFDADCIIHSYTLYYTQKNNDPVELNGEGAQFSKTILATIKRAKIGDQYAFTNVKAKCPGDTSARRVNGLAFRIR